MKQFKIGELPCIKSLNDFFVNILILTIIFGMIFPIIVILIWERGVIMSDLFKEILVSILTGAITSAGVTIFAYFKFLRKIPEETEDKINKLLNDRLNYETSNHNSLVQMMSPTNEHLSSEHREIQRDINNIKFNVKDLKNKRKADYSLMNDAGKKILSSIDDLTQFSYLLTDLNNKNMKLKEENQQLHDMIEDYESKCKALERRLEDFKEAKYSYIKDVSEYLSNYPRDYKEPER